MNNALSVIQMYFIRLDTLVERMGVSSEIAQTLGKAIDYHLCLSPYSANSGVWAWQNGACECTRVCENGGVLDPETCTCSCPGDTMHGWKGPTCTESYGWCQPGPGTGNPASAASCATTNQCNSWFTSSTCSG